MGNQMDAFGCLPVWVWPIIIVLVLILGAVQQAGRQAPAKAPPTAPEPGSQLVLCPYCRGSIKHSRLACPFCKHDLEPGPMLKEGMLALKNGDRDRADHLLRWAAWHDQGNITAWLWLSGAVATDADRRYCLEKILAIDPKHAAARRGIAALDKRERASN